MYLKFILVGIINTLFGYSIYSGFIYLDFHYSVATLLATILGIIFNFKTYGKYVFSDNSWNKIFKFIIVYGFLYMLNILGIFILTFYKFNLYLSGLSLLLPIAITGFYLNKRFVYEKIN
jgi:putative flippase GtrA